MDQVDGRESFEEDLSLDEEEKQFLGLYNQIPEETEYQKRQRFLSRSFDKEINKLETKEDNKTENSA